jgi:cyclase
MSTSFTKGLSELGDGLYAYLQPTGTWGYSNAGLITDGGSSLLVDTLYTLPLTEEMLATMRAAVPAARSIDMLVNSHADGDHTYGNQLLGAIPIIATERAAADMAIDFTAEQLRGVLANSKNLGAAGRFLEQIMAPFDFSGIDLTLPNRTFTGTLELNVGNKVVELIDVGPAHSSGDLIVHVPDDRIVFLADLLFVGGHPAVWAGPISNWIAVCDRVLAMDIDVVVPGHGPITDKTGVREFRDYLAFVESEAARMFEAGLSIDEASRAIDLSAYADWGDAERIVIAIDTTYRELAGDTSPRDKLKLFGDMGELTDAKAAR